MSIKLFILHRGVIFSAECTIFLVKKWIKNLMQQTCRSGMSIIVGTIERSFPNFPAGIMENLKKISTNYDFLSLQFVTMVTSGRTRVEF